jgi:aminoglycoside 6'-N-acetyltransferase
MTTLPTDGPRMRALRSQGDLLLRELGVSDIPVLARWRSDPRVIEFYSGRDRPLDEEGVRRHYFVREDRPASETIEEYQACIVELRGRPVAFVQYYRLGPTEWKELGRTFEDRTFGIDYFIGEPELWNQGLGTRILCMTRDHLLSDQRAHRLVADPHIDNLRSVRALEKAGFRKIQLLKAHEVFEGIPTDCWLMELRGP